MSHNDQEIRHKRTRAIGQLYARTVDNGVAHVTINEIEFSNSTTADRFMEQKRMQYGTRTDQKKVNRLRWIGKDDDSD